MILHRAILGIVGALSTVMLTACSANRSASNVTVNDTKYIDESYVAADTAPCPGPNDFVSVGVIAEMTHYERPVYPEAARKARQEGIVWIKALVGSRGDVVDAVIYKSCGVPALDSAALAAAPKCRFNPALQNDHPVCMWVAYKVEFKL